MKTIQIITNIQLDWIEINEEISAYQKIKTSSLGKSSFEEGIAYTKELENTSDALFSVVKKNDRQSVLPMMVGFADFCKNQIYRECIKEQFGMENTSPYTTLKDGGSLEVVLFDNYSNTFYDINGNVLPMKVRFDYMRNLDNSEYDLDEALKILTSNSNVEPANGNELEISRIPYYNATETAYEQIEFLFSANQREMEYIIKNSKEDVIKTLFKLDKFS